MNPTCAGCRFWRADRYRELGNCLRYAPRPDNTGGEKLWAVTSGKDWCGEHSPAEPPQPEGASEK